MDQRPYYDIPDCSLPLGCHARNTCGKYHTGGTWVYSTNTVYGITRRSHHLLNPTWNTSGAIIYRCRRGNGFYGSVLGKMYQDQYAYFVPLSINNVQGEPARQAFATAVSNWQNVLSDAQKQVYYDRARNMCMTGYNLYISEYVRDNA